MRRWTNVRNFTAEFSSPDLLTQQEQSPVGAWSAPNRPPLLRSPDSPHANGNDYAIAPWQNCPYGIVVIGTSMGGLRALEAVLSGLPKNFPVPVAIVQHRHRNSDNTLREFLQRQSALPVVEVEDKDLITPGRVYLAPANYHLLVEAQKATYEAAVTPKEIETPGEREFSHFALSTDTPVCHARPAIDVLFESAADTYAEGAIGVILTGASQDGTQGLAKIKACGGLSIVQEPTTAESPTMPSAAIASVAIDWTLPLSEIAPFLVHLCCPALT